MLGDRLSATLSSGDLRLAAAAVLLSPFVPLLFMGEEYGETAPFQYFVSHGDPALIEAVRRGRSTEFASFAWQGDVPDPQCETTFLRSKLDRRLQAKPDHRQLMDFYRKCLRLRSTLPALARVEKETLAVQGWEPESVLMAHGWTEGEDIVILLHFGLSAAELRLPLPAGRWRCELDSRHARWGGPDQESLRELVVEGAGTCRLPPRSAALWRWEHGGSA
jgi:maltooligosyltrehalose trehalohydrolase